MKLAIVLEGYFKRLATDAAEDRRLGIVKTSSNPLVKKTSRLQKFADQSNVPLADVQKMYSHLRVVYGENYPVIMAKLKRQLGLL